MAGLRFALLAAMALTLAAPAARAQDEAKAFPAKPVRIVIGLAAGGGVDVLTRILAQKLSENLGQQVVVENRPGASAILAAETVARAAPDGYTLMMAPSGPMVFNAVMFPKLSYSPQKDFAPISLVASFPLVVVVNAGTSIRTLPELVAYAKANPAKANYAASTSSFQLITELLNIQTGAGLEFVPYKGTNESLNAVIAGDVLTTIADSGPASGALRGGKVRGLAVTSQSRMPAFADMPTVREAGYPDLEAELWMGLFAPAGTPRAIVRRLEEEVRRAVASPEVQERMAALNVTPVGSTGEELARQIATEIPRWTDVAKARNIKPNN